MKEIKLCGKKGLGRVVLVSDSDFEYLNQFRWHLATPSKNSEYAVRAMYIKTTFPSSKKTAIKKQIFMHREIMKPDKKFYVDHKDRNGLNNQRENLRIATSAQNGHNRVGWKNSYSKYIGVSFDNNRKKWIAYLFVNNKCVFRKRFDTEMDAVLARDEEAKKYHGEFVRLNIVEN